MLVLPMQNSVWGSGAAGAFCAVAALATGDYDLWQVRELTAQPAFLISKLCYLLLPLLFVAWRYLHSVRRATPRIICCWRCTAEM
jgi:hypothetical protein